MVDGKRTRKQFAIRAEAKEELDKFREDARNPKPVVEETPTLTLAEALTRLLDLKARKRTLAEDRPAE
jgi:hypothetical protein